MGAASYHGPLGLGVFTVTRSTSCSFEVRFSCSWGQFWDALPDMTSRFSVWPVNFLPVSFMVKIFALCSYWTWRYILTRCPVSAETYRTLRKTFLEAVLLVRPTLVSAPRVFRQCLKLRLSPRFLLFPVLACVCSCCWAACGNRVLCLCVSGSFTIPPVVVVTCAGWEWWSQGTLGDTYTALVYSGAPAYRWLFFFFFFPLEFPNLRYLLFVVPPGSFCRVPPECTAFFFFSPPRK